MTPAKTPTRSSRGWTSVRMILTPGLTLTLLSATGLAFLSFGATRPSNLGVRNGTLAVCPDSPNCVSSLTGRPTHSMAPITYDGDSATAMQSVLDVVSGMDGARVVSSDDEYIHCEFSTPLFRFVDDVEFLLDTDESVIHFRSASRIGHSDFGQNRQRMNEIRSRFTEASSDQRPTTSKSQLSIDRMITVRSQLQNA